MAQILLSSIEGFSFCGVEVNNTNGIYLLDVSRNSAPELKYNEFIVPNRHGNYRYDDSYSNQDIIVVIGIEADTVQERKVKIRNLISSWIQKEGKLIFNDEPTLFYNAKFYNAIPTQETEMLAELTITFNASPFKYELYTDARDMIINETYNTIINDMDGVLINTALWQDVNTSTFKQVINNGNYETLPIISITGTAQKISLTFADTAFAFVGLNNETVFIDSEKMIVYTLSGEKKINRLTDFNGLFPTIKTGVNDVSISGTNFDVDIEIKYRNTYVV